MTYREGTPLSVALWGNSFPGQVPGSIERGKELSPLPGRATYRRQINPSCSWEQGLQLFIAHLPPKVNKAVRSRKCKKAIYWHGLNTICIWCGMLKKWLPYFFFKASVFDSFTIKALSWVCIYLAERDHKILRKCSYPISIISEVSINTTLWTDIINSETDNFLWNSLSIS